MGTDWIDVVAAWECIEKQAPVRPQEECGLDQASGRVLSERVLTAGDFPPFDRAAMDGFAVRAREIESATAAEPVRLHVVGEATPGRAGPVAAQPHTTIRIMTGAAVPVGWDCVVPVELTTGFERDPVAIHRPLSRGQHIVGRATERRAGTVLYERGHRLSTADVGALAMVGCVRPRVFRQPSVAILATGNELVDPSTRPGPLQVRNSNSVMLQAQCGRFAQPLEHLGTAPDDVVGLRSLLEKGLQSDLLLVTGGVSAGAYDFVEDILVELGVDIHFRKIAVQPGKPVTFGVHRLGCVLALPGNPVSAWTTFRLFGIPLLLRMQGARQSRPRFERVAADFDWQRRNPKWTLIPGRRQDGGVGRVPYGGSGDLLAFSGCDGQIVLPPDVLCVAPGDPVLFWPSD